MAAGTWKVTYPTKLKMGNGTMNLTGEFKLALFGKDSNLKTSASARPRGTYASLTDEVSGGGYVAGGYGLTGENWVVKDTSQYKFSVATITFTAEGSTIDTIKFAAICMSAGGHIAAYVTLTTTEFALAVNNTATLTPPANGVFYLA